MTTHKLKKYSIQNYFNIMKPKSSTNRQRNYTYNKRYIGGDFSRFTILLPYWINYKKQKLMLIATIIQKHSSKQNRINPNFYFLKKTRSVEIGAGEGNRTLVTCLGSKSSTIELHPQLPIFIRPTLPTCQASFAALQKIIEPHGPNSQ